MLYREEEEPVETLRYYNNAFKFSYYKIKDLYGITLNEFLNMNRWEIDELVKIAERELDRREKEGREVSEEMELKLQALEKGVEF